MVDNSRSIDRIEQLRHRRGIKSKRDMMVRAKISLETMRLLERGHKPVRERLRRLAGVLGCEPDYLEEVASDIQIDARNDDARELLDVYNSVPEPHRSAFIEGVKSLRRLIPD